MWWKHAEVVRLVLVPAIFHSTGQASHFGAPTLTRAPPLIRRPQSTSPDSRFERCVRYVDQYGGHAEEFLVVLLEVVVEKRVPRHQKIPKDDPGGCIHHSIRSKCFEVEYMASGHQVDIPHVLALDLRRARQGDGSILFEYGDSHEDPLTGEILATVFPLAGPHKSRVVIFLQVYHCVA